MNWFRNAPLSRKLTALTMLISGFALLLGCGAFAIYEQTEFRREMARDIAIIADMFDDDVAPGLAFNDPASIVDTITTLNAHPHIFASCVYDHTGKIVASYVRPGWNDRFQFPARARTSQHFATDHLDTFQDVTLKGEFIGVVYIGSDLNELQAHVWRYAAIVGTLLVACSLVSLLLASKLQRVISQPILDLAQTVATIATGKNYAVRAQKRGDDELGHLIDGFNDMLAQIQARDSALESARDNLEHRVEERTAELARENVERKRAEEARRTSEAFLQSLVENLPVYIYRTDPDGRMTFANTRFCEREHLPLADLLGKTAFDRLPQAEAARQRQTDLQAMTTGQTYEGMEERATADGKNCFLHVIKVPIFDASGRCTGLQGMFLDITESRRADAELRWKTALLEAQVDSSLDGLLIVDNAGKKLFQNQRTIDLWKLPPEIAGENDDEKQIQFIVNRTKHPDRFAEKVRFLYAHPLESSRDEIEFKDGMVLDRYSAPVVGKDGTHYGRIWAFRDITERKHSEAELAKAHRELLVTSRQAGMAEVATGVLHNVGNVLNSVNVSATLVVDHVRHSKAGNIAKVAAMFAQHKADLAEFLTTDPRGQMIPGYLGTLAESLAVEHTTMIAELNHLRKNIEHIKEIVAMQQSYARTSGVIETVSVPDMIEDALRINAGSLARHGVDTFRDYQARPVVTTDKHKVMQVLINLVRNAKYACDESGRTDKQITVRTTSDDRGVKIAIIDNGVGIPAENLTRIFNHGFTTRKTGHGFGLHSGALAARELGGSLHVRSEGAGHGATFTLELPYKPEVPRP